MKNIYENHLRILVFITTLTMLISCNKEDHSVIDSKPVPTTYTETEVIITEVKETPVEELIESPIHVAAEPKVVYPNLLGFTTRYDSLFNKYSKMYLPTHDPLYLKAQCIQESGLRPDVTSWAGAKGLCQFMGVTWNEVSGELKFKQAANPFDPELSVQAAAYYMAKLRRGWSSPRPEHDRMKLARASYNAGFGSLLKAQEACGNGSLYDEIIICLIDITGERNSNETIHYVKNIEGYYKQLVIYDN